MKCVITVCMTHWPMGYLFILFTILAMCRWKEPCFQESEQKLIETDRLHMKQTRDPTVSVYLYFTRLMKDSTWHLQNVPFLEIFINNLIILNTWCRHCYTVIIQWLYTAGLRHKNYIFSLFIARFPDDL